MIYPEVNDELAKKVIFTFGKEKQVIKCMEELAELAKAVSKANDNSKDDLMRLDLSSEIADVLIMINQMRILFNLNKDAILDMISFKESRMEERLND